MRKEATRDNDVVYELQYRYLDPQLESLSQSGDGRFGHFLRILPRNVIIHASAHGSMLFTCIGSSSLHVIHIIPWINRAKGRIHLTPPSCAAGFH